MSMPVRYKLFGVEITPLARGELQGVIARAVGQGQRWIIANHNLHSVYLFQRDPKFREFYAQAKLAHIDGMSLVFLARLLGHPISRDQRVTFVDLVRPFMAQAERSGWRVFFLGSRPGVGEKAAAILKSEYPGLDIKAHHGYFDNRPESAENDEVISLINSFSPNVMIVGMGMPRQEHWILDNIYRLKTNAVLSGGACMDYVAGEVPTPPRWMGRVGLEWLYRLLSEPRRLWKRYLIEPLFICLLLIKQLYAEKNTDEKQD
jgi:N-acetylglucosaminyldiphosphoundecaprenol N-acetyl-beta-D-mannosaminyltransferase